MFMSTAFPEGKQSVLIIIENNYTDKILYSSSDEILTFITDQSDFNAIRSITSMLITLQLEEKCLQNY